MRHRRPFVTDVFTGTITASLLLFMLLALAPVAEADAQYRIGNRLYRHQSGFLYGQSRPLFLDRRHSYYYDGYFVGRECGNNGPAVDDDRYQFDARRQALLNHAARVRFADVAAPTSRGGVRFRPATPENNQRGWDLIASGKSVKALGFFTAQLMSGPGRPNARLGYVIAAAQMGDDATALVTLRSTLTINPQSLRDFSADDDIRPALEAVIARYEESAKPTGRQRFVHAALCEMLDDHDGALTVLASLPPQAHEDKSVRMLKALAALGIVEMEIAAAPARGTMLARR